MSTLHFQPTSGIRETGRNTQNYVLNHLDTFWAILKPLLPYLFALLAFDQIIRMMLGIDPETGSYKEFMLGEIVSAYFLSCLVISWHRVIIHGADNYKAVDPFKPEKRDIAYMAMAIGLIIAAMILGAVGGAITSIIHKGLFVIFLIALIPVILFLFMRLSFYFPAKATGADLTLKESFALSKGYALRLFFTPIFATWKVILATIVYAIIAFAIVFAIGMMLGGNINGASPVSLMLEFIASLPIALFLNPLISILSITVLSNYYQYATQNQMNNAAKLEKHETDD